MATRRARWAPAMVGLGLVLTVASARHAAAAPAAQVASPTPTLGPGASLPVAGGPAGTDPRGQIVPPTWTPTAGAPPSAGATSPYSASAPQPATNPSPPLVG